MDCVPGGSDTNVIKCTNEEIFNIMKTKMKDSVSEQIEILEAAWTEKLGRNICILADQKPAFSKYFHSLRIKWQNCNRTEQNFKKKYANWLLNTAEFIIKDESLSTQSKTGRPSLSFSDASDRSRRRKTEELRTSNTTEELAYATQMNLRFSGQLNASKIVKDVTLTSPTRATKYMKAATSQVEQTLSNDAALSVLIEHKFSKRTYQSIRNIGKENNCKLYPSYNNVVKSKRLCYPPRTDITIKENYAEVKLQSILDHTAQRILLLQREVIGTLSIENIKNLHLTCKWGCDGSSGHSVYKQKFNEAGISDENVFFTSFVPLQLVCKDEKLDTDLVIWQNPRTSSPRFCRPIRLQFEHKNAETTAHEVNDIEQQINSLNPLVTQVHGMEIRVQYNMNFTMIDNKVCNAVSETKSTLRCYLCNATSKDFNDIRKMLQRKVETSNLRFGISTLHAWIRLFECCLHLSYKLTIKKWRVNSDEEREIVETRKSIIQRGFQTQLGLIVDRPKPGCGSTNDGNMARRFFENSTTSATITGVSGSLINRFHVILQVISSGFEIDNELFRAYFLETANEFVKLYPWYYMPTSIYKLLIHGPEIIEHFLLPIGQLSKEAQEARNKDIKRFREDFTRKCSREKTMEDVFNRLIITSDPYISSIRKQPRKFFKLLLPQALELLTSSTIPVSSTDNLQIAINYDSESSVTDNESDANCDSENDEDFCL
ncbi:uncharacterized protein LOC114935764 [Nylanderia fulva]|uniref:uncharacterized protein LOC114935764 n=1 Tax=Nylanderia fulva TaxID=613905 RepID=UPI0010FB6D97|nr:uncharacterized protein LOC114935764 [Nylanderia fulva]